MGSAAINIAVALTGGLLAGHVARAKDATNENAGCATLAPAVQADLEDIAQAYSAGQVSAAQASAMIADLDAQTFAYLQKQVGPSGTSWSGSPKGQASQVTSNPPCAPGQQVLYGGNLTQAGAGSGGTCDKSCTVGCCLYFNWWEPAFNCAYQMLLGGKSFTLSLAPIPSNKYGFPGMSAYTVSFSAPPVTTVSSVSSTVTNALNLLTGGSTSPASGGSSASPSSLNAQPGTFPTGLVVVAGFVALILFILVAR